MQLEAEEEDNPILAQPAPGTEPAVEADATESPEASVTTAGEGA